jgi:hypothetical protein
MDTNVGGIVPCVLVHPVFACLKGGEREREREWMDGQVCDVGQRRENHRGLREWPEISDMWSTKCVSTALSSPRVR